MTRKRLPDYVPTLQCSRRELVDYIPRTRWRMPKPDGTLLLTTGQVAELLNMSPRMVQSLAASGAIPTVRVGTLRRFRPGDVEAFVAELPTQGWWTQSRQPAWLAPPSWGQSGRQFTLGEPWPKGWGLDRLRRHRKDLYDLVQAGKMREIDALKRAARDFEVRMAQRDAVAKNAPPTSTA